MISFRYHIVTITAVFLAIALGFVLGAAIRPTEQTVKRNVNTLTSKLNDARAQIAELRTAGQQQDGVVKNLSSRVIHGALAGHQIVYVDDGSASSWEGGVRKAMSDATATDLGTLTLTGKWTDPNSGADLVAIAAGAGVKVGSDGPGPALMAALGQGFGSAAGAQLATQLANAGYVSNDAKGTGSWPPAGSVVVAFTSGATTPQSTALAAFARAAGKTTPVAVVAATVDNLGAVGLLRGTGSVPQRLVTFDSGSADPTGVGSVLALGAAIDGRGGHFGNGPGLSYLPPV